MIDFSQQTYQNILAQMLEQVPAKFDTRETAPIPTALSPAAYQLAGFYISLNQVQLSAFIQTATGQSLDYLALGTRKEKFSSPHPAVKRHHRLVS